MYVNEWVYVTLEVGNPKSSESVGQLETQEEPTLQVKSKAFHLLRSNSTGAIVK